MKAALVAMTRAAFLVIRHNSVQNIPDSWQFLQLFVTSQRQIDKNFD
jgi:hypothetical protein